MSAQPSHLIDLDTYFARIGYSGTPTPALGTLQTLHALHTEHIPFENLDPLLGRLVALDLPSLDAKLVRSHRGGYCYEHNLLFAHVLEQLGFTPRRLAARVLWNQPADTLPHRSHMLVQVSGEQRQYIVDTGFGGNTLTGPICLDQQGAQQTPHGQFRVSSHDGLYLLATLLQGEWRKLYQFDLQAQYPIDYE